MQDSVSNDDNNPKPSLSLEAGAEDRAVETRATAGDENAAGDPAMQLETLAVERDRLSAENEDLRDRLLRRQADFDNFRRRVERERSELGEYAGMETMRALLPTLDDFERALAAAPDVSGPESEWVKGIQIIYQRLSEALRKLGLEAIESAGKPFDPNIHHAVEMVASEDVPDHTVIDEYQKGYNFKGRLLREAMVRVAVNSAGN